MASVINDPNGRKRIVFTAPDGKRRPVRLGKASQRTADFVCQRVEDLVRARAMRTSPTNETIEWLAGADDWMYRKLAAVGLVDPRESATLGAFTQAYIDGRVDIKPRTRINLERARSYLLDYFDADRDLRTFTAGDAEDFRLYLIGQGKADNTVRRAIGRARQFFKAAMKRGLIRSNPIEGLAASVRANHDKFHFVSRDDAQKVIDACPDAEWRLIFALARYGGLRCPSELLALRWRDVDFGADRIRIPSPKTEAHEGKASRMIPIFPELRPHLMDVFAEAEVGAEHVITHYRGGGVNLRTQLTRIIERAGLIPWVKLFQNLRSTRETELAETFPLHVVCAWIGNSQPVAAKHYLQVTDEHFEQASGKAARNAARTMQESAGNDRKADSEIAAFAGVFQDVPVGDSKAMPPEGLEPSTN